MVSQGSPLRFTPTSLVALVLPIHETLKFAINCVIIVDAMENVETEFRLDQKIVYPSQGVGKITEIFQKEFNGNLVFYYKIYIEVSDMVVMVPVEKAHELGIRAIVSRQEAEAALESIGGDYEPPTSDWKLRYQTNMELLKRGTTADIASIVRCLYHRSKIKELPILERKLYDNAKKLLIDEISESFGVPEKEVEQLLHEKLEPIGLKIEKKQPRSLAEEDAEFAVDEEEDEDKKEVDDEEDED